MINCYVGYGTDCEFLAEGFKTLRLRNWLSLKMTENEILKYKINILHFLLTMYTIVSLSGYFYDIFILI